VFWHPRKARLVSALVAGAFQIHVSSFMAPFFLSQYLLLHGTRQGAGILPGGSASDALVGPAPSPTLTSAPSLMGPQLFPPLSRLLCLFLDGLLCSFVLPLFVFLPPPCSPFPPAKLLKATGSSLCPDDFHSGNCTLSWSSSAFFPIRLTPSAFVSPETSWVLCGVGVFLFCLFLDNPPHPL